jgi:predicted nuclease of predicted toxin-antitoxin system
MPRSLVPVLQDAGYHAVDVRDVGLRGANDSQVFAFAQASGAILITADRDFSSVLTFRPGSHAGIIFVRIPNLVPNRIVCREVLRAVSELADTDITGSVVVVELGRTRVRRPTFE